MNPSNAVFATYEDIQILNVFFEDVRGVTDEEVDRALLNNTIKLFTYCAYRMPEFDRGQLLIVPAGPFDKLKVATFHSYGDLTDLDLDSFEIQYKWILGPVPAAQLAEYKTLNEMNKERLKTAKQARIARLREQAHQALRGNLQLESFKDS